MKKQNGITLIALVITIVILVILAGVSINLVLGQNGIITRSKDAKTLTEETQANEQVALAEVGIWNYINRPNSIIVSKAMIDSSTGAKSTLISGECWDTTLQWMVNASANKEINAGYDINSTGKGYDRELSGFERDDYYETINLHTTGYYAVNRIYDMAGNMWEWTTENSNWIEYERFAVSRGAGFKVSLSLFSVGSAIRISNMEIAEWIDFSFRVVLYK